MAHAQGLQQLEAWFPGVSDTLAVAQATATFRDGRRFTESGEAPPKTWGARCGRTLPAWRSPGPRLAVCGMRSILPGVRLRNWGENLRTARGGALQTWGRSAPAWGEARTDARPASLTCIALPARAMEGVLSTLTPRGFGA
jgi:hypothetical protein